MSLRRLLNVAHAFLMQNRDARGVRDVEQALARAAQIVEQAAWPRGRVIERQAVSPEALAALGAAFAMAAPGE